MDTSKIKYIVFDVFGTCVDWHGTILKAGKKLSEKYDLEVDWSSLAREWRIDGYFKAVFETAAGKREYVPCDEVFMRFLKETLVPKYHMEAVSEEDLRDFCNVWHRLQPWEDVLDGLHRLTTKYAIGPFTNGDFDLMIDLKKNSALPWDFITTADIFKRYKPDLEIYKDEIRLLHAKPEEVVMVAAHPFDMDNAKVVGYTTIYVPRPDEFGADSDYVEPDGKNPVDYVCKDFGELATLLNV